MATTRKKGESFADLLRTAWVRSGLTSTELGRRIGVTQKTMHRWTWQKQLPAPRTRVALLHQLRWIDYALLTQMADALGVDRVHLPPKPAPIGAAPSGVVAAHALRGALLRAIDHLPNESGRRVREAVGMVVAQIAELGLDAATAQAILAVPNPQPSAPAAGKPRR